MATGLPAALDWTDASAYAPLLGMERAGFAWEWLRRKAEYRDAFEAAHRSGEAEAVAARWGLHCLEPPDRAALEARPVWRSDVHPLVLPVTAGHHGRTGGRFDLARLAPMATIATDTGGLERLLLSDGRRAIRLDVVSGTLARGPVTLCVALTGLEGVEPRLLVLRRLLALWRTGRFSRSLHPVPLQAARWVAMLRAHDGLMAGASQREIAARLLGPEAEAPLWRVAVPSLRSRVQRLVRSARHMAEGGYLELLR